MLLRERESSEDAPVAGPRTDEDAFVSETQIPATARTAMPADDSNELQLVRHHREHLDLRSSGVHADYERSLLEVLDEQLFDAHTRRLDLLGERTHQLQDVPQSPREVSTC